jgi:hypothetical protein
MCSLLTHLSLFIACLSALPSFFKGKPLAIYRSSYSVAALRVDVVLPHFYEDDFTCAVYLLSVYSFRACRCSPLSSQIRLYFSDVLSLVRVPKLVSAHQGQERRPKGVAVKVERRINAT